MNTLNNNALLTDPGNLTNLVAVALKKFESHPSVIDIKNKVAISTMFSISKVEVSDIELEIKNLNAKKAGTSFKTSCIDCS